MRPDLSNSLIHFTKGPSVSASYESLLSILQARSVTGSSRMIRSGEKCVCFSEVPIAAVSGGFTNNRGHTRYSQFGVLFSKDFVFAQGGRPAIYQPELEYEYLHPQAKWRHVRLELRKENPIDFMWEREWRVRTEALSFTPDEVVVVLPNKEWEEQFDQNIREASYLDAYSWSIVLGDLAWHYEEGNPWKSQRIN